MVRSRDRDSAGSTPKWEGRKPDDEIRDFLKHALRNAESSQLEQVVDFLVAAGTRYDRYMMRKDEWWSYATRRRQLKRLSELASELVLGLANLDILSRDDLEKRVDRRIVDGLVGSLVSMRVELENLAATVQTDGKPRNIAEERWITEVADAYEVTFGKRATISGSSSAASKQRGKFFQLLEVSRPSSLPRFGKLSVRQIGRILRRRSTFGKRRVTLL